MLHYLLFKCELVQQTDQLHSSKQFSKVLVGSFWLSLLHSSLFCACSTDFQKYQAYSLCRLLCLSYLSVQHDCCHLKSWLLSIDGLFPCWSLECFWIAASRCLKGVDPRHYQHHASQWHICEPAASTAHSEVSLSALPLAQASKRPLYSQWSGQKAPAPSLACQTTHFRALCSFASLSLGPSTLVDASLHSSTAPTLSATQFHPSCSKLTQRSPANAPLIATYTPAHSQVLSWSHSLSSELSGRFNWRSTIDSFHPTTHFTALNFSVWARP